MKNPEHRIFISDLPEAATDKDIRSVFSKYGKVTSIEIKTRKELTTKNKSYFFGYINLETDHSTLNQCFRDFQDEPWHGDYVKLQIAKESFLDRLKREREESQKKEQYGQGSENIEVAKVTPIVNIAVPKKSAFKNEDAGNGKKLPTNVSILNEETQDTNVENIIKKSKRKYRTLEEGAEVYDTLDKHDNSSDLKIRKNNSNNLVINKIPSFGHEPIIVFTTKKEKSKNLSQANIKRLESLKNLKKGYQNEKDLIKNALKNIDAHPKNNKIVFDDVIEDLNTQKSAINGPQKNKNVLFDQGDSDSDEFQGNFEIQKHLEGEKGKTLLELQSKFHNDKRFALDKRFLEDKNEKMDELNDESLETEKKKELNILEQVLGKKVARPNSKTSEKISTKSMLRFDPTQANTNLELQNAPEEPKKKKSKKDLILEAKQEQHVEKPEVSKDVFYKVSEDLKETFQESQSQGFSLLSAFKQNNDSIEDFTDNAGYDPTSVTKGHQSKNPFKYDSSDEEDETADIPHINDKTKLNQGLQKTEKEKSNTARSLFWTESFFFKPDDHRLQDGFDFIEKLKASDDKEFSKVRQGLKGVIRTKVRNSERKNRMFKKKLGGGKSNKRKHIRIKKALKR